MSELRIRQAVRALVLDEEDNVLVVHFDWDGLDVIGGFWASPGGGVEADESPVEALQRELIEEVGLAEPDIAGPGWQLTRLFPMTNWDGQTDVNYLVRAPHFEPGPQVDLLAESVHGVRWFSVSEICAEMETFSPRDLAAHLIRVLEQGVPEQVPDLSPLI